MNAGLSSTFVHPLTELQPLTEGELSTLKKIRNRKTLVVLSGYVTVLALLGFAWLWSWAKSTRRSEERQTSFESLAPYFIGFFFIVATIYFTRYYLKSVKPYVNDIREAKKIIFFCPAQKYKTPYFDAYYMKTTFREKSMIRINKQLYESIAPESYASIAYTPHARFVFAIECEQVKMTFNEYNSVIEM